MQRGPNIGARFSLNNLLELQRRMSGWRRKEPRLDFRCQAVAELCQRNELELIEKVQCVMLIGPSISVFNLLILFQSHHLITTANLVLRTVDGIMACIGPPETFLPILPSLRIFCSRRHKFYLPSLLASQLFVWLIMWISSIFPLLFMSREKVYKKPTTHSSLELILTVFIGA